jgi:hypothetical protein
VNLTRPAASAHGGRSWRIIAWIRCRGGNSNPHRLLAIGHLCEAEDESQAWPDLHDAIRKARRAYQRAGTIPDFDALAAQRWPAV